MDKTDIPLSPVHISPRGFTARRSHTLGTNRLINSIYFVRTTLIPPHLRTINFNQRSMNAERIPGVFP